MKKPVARSCPDTRKRDEENRVPTLRQALPIALPVMIGYFTVGATFGLTAAGWFGWFWPVIISLIGSLAPLSS